MERGYPLVPIGNDSQGKVEKRTPWAIGSKTPFPKFFSFLDFSACIGRPPKAESLKPRMLFLQEKPRGFFVETAGTFIFILLFSSPVRDP